MPNMESTKKGGREKGVRAGYVERAREKERVVAGGKRFAGDHQILKRSIHIQHDKAQLEPANYDDVCVCVNEMICI